jgi:alkylation response protein AidB-like acyl-CoA dehydrogenase
MELELIPERELLRETCQRFLRDRWPLPRVRAVAEQREPLDDRYLADVADLGWFAMFVAEDEGGGSPSGEPAADAALVAEIRGATLAPGPFAAANAAAALIARAGDEGQRGRLLPPMVEGAAHVLVAAGGDALWGDQGVTVAEEGRDLVLRGSLVITDGSARTSHVVVAAGAPVRAVIVSLDAPGVTRVPLLSLDLTRPAERVVLDGVRLSPDHVLGVTPDALDHVRAVAVTLSVAETVGALSRLFDMTRTYAMERVAFGRPVGSFQAIKHLMADMSLVVEQAKSVSVAATRSLSHNRPYALEVASIAKVFVAEHAPRVAQDCLQVHGGIGFAWEHDLHLYLRRIAADAALFGAAGRHRELILAAHHDELEAAS